MKHEGPNVTINSIKCAFVTGGEYAVYHCGIMWRTCHLDAVRMWAVMRFDWMWCARLSSRDYLYGYLCVLRGGAYMVIITSTLCAWAP